MWNARLYLARKQITRNENPESQAWKSPPRKRGAAFALTKTNDGNKARRFPSLPCRAMRHTIYSEKGEPVEKARFWINHYRRTRCYRINGFAEITVTWFKKRRLSFFITTRHCKIAEWSCEGCKAGTARVTLLESMVRITSEACSVNGMKKNGLFGEWNGRKKRRKVKILSKIPRERPLRGWLKRRKSEKGVVAKRFIRNPDRNYQGSGDNR